MSVERRGQVTHVRMESTGNRRNSLVLAEAGRLPRGGTSRMTRESHVRICERLGMKFPGPTRRQSNFENSGSIPPAVAFVFADARCLASLVTLQLLLLFTGCDQAPLRGQQP
jgi:hypothetical protein